MQSSDKRVQTFHQRNTEIPEICHHLTARIQDWRSTNQRVQEGPTVQHETDHISVHKSQGRQYKSSFSTYSSDGHDWTSELSSHLEFLLLETWDVLTLLSLRRHDTQLRTEVDELNDWLPLHKQRWYVTQSEIITHDISNFTELKKSTRMFQSRTSSPPLSMKSAVKRHFFSEDNIWNDIKCVSKSSFFLQ